jgi:benzoylformate decarboxylase
MSPSSPVDPLPPGMPVIHITERDAELGKNYATGLAIRANIRETLRALLPVVRARRTAAEAANALRRFNALIPRNWTAQRRKAGDEALSAAETTPIDPRYLMKCLGDSLPENAVVVEEALTAAAALAAFVPARDAKSFYGLASGGLGFGLPGAIGVSLAQPGRPVVAAIGDGSAMYSVQALWTAAHLKLPITYLIINNRSYRIIKERLVASRRSDRFVGMDLRDPEIDFVSVAEGLGMQAQRISDPREISSVLNKAVRSGAPNLVEVVVADGFESSAPRPK